MPSKTERDRQKRERFVKLANNRVNRAIKELRLIGNLSNRGAYAYTDEDAKKILRAIQKEFDALRTRFTGSSSPGESEFSLEL
jgi:hypothetical protein